MGWLARARHRLRAAARVAWRPASTIRIPAAVLQRRVQSRFPLETTRYGCTLTLRDPAIWRRAGESSIALEVALGVRFPGGLHPTWRGEIALRLDYRQDQGAFYLREPRLWPSVPASSAVICGARKRAYQGNGGGGGGGATTTGPR